MPRISIEGYEPKHLSYSSVSGYRMCGKKFELQKILRLEEKPGLAAIGGNALHTVTEAIDLAEFYGISYEEAVALRRGDASSSSKLDNVRVGADAGQTDNDGSAA